MQAAQDVARTAAGKIGDGLFCQAVVESRVCIARSGVNVLTFAAQLTTRKNNHEISR